MRKLLLIILLLSSGCATVDSVMPKSDGAGIFNACKIADGASTMIAVKSGKFMELNPLFKGIVGGGMSWIPFIGITAAIIIAYNYADNEGLINEPSHVAANTVTCAVAARNVFLMTK